MLIINKEEHLHSKLVSLATLSQVNDFFLLSLKSTKVLSYKAGYFFTASFNLSSISLDTSFHLLFFFVPSFILYFTQNSLSLCYIACVCYFTIHTIKLQTNLWSILLHVRKLSNFFDILRTVCVGLPSVKCVHTCLLCAYAYPHAYAYGPLM